MKEYVEGFMEENPSSARKKEPEKGKFILPEDPEAERKLKIEGMTTNDLIDACFQGIDLMTYTGDAFSRSFLVSSINSAIDSAEQIFDIAITPQRIEQEAHDYEGNALWDYQYTQTYKRPVRSVEKMEYFLGNDKIMEVPNHWIQVDKRMGDVTIVPTSGAAPFITPAFGVTVPFFMHRSYLPMAVRITYEAGMDKEDIPANLLEWIYKRASIPIFEVWGDQIIGAGIASSSISIDGLSQSIGTTQSAMYGGASARILEYRKDLEELTKIIRRHFARFDSVVL